MIKIKMTKVSNKLNMKNTLKENLDFIFTKSQRKYSLW